MLLALRTKTRRRVNESKVILLLHLLIGLGWTKGGKRDEGCEVMNRRQEMGRIQSFSFCLPGVVG